MTYKGSRAFDAALAALAAASAGFLAFAMPEPVMSGLVSATGLPQFVPAANPPLGDTARLAAIGAAALFAFALVWGLMAAVERVPVRRRALSDLDAPRLRRADAHPDAPSRRPLMAAQDLGEPLDLDAGAETAPLAFEPEAEAPRLPAFLVPEAFEPAAEVEPEPEPEPEPETEPEPLPIAALAAQLPEPARASEDSLAGLVGRIESGLGRKRQALPRSDEPQAEEPPAPAPADEQVGHRLRSAIRDLEKIAARGA